MPTNKLMENSDQETATSTKFKYINGPQLPDEISIDGISGFSGRNGVYKLECYRVLGVDDNGAEVRQVVKKLAMPVSATAELAQIVQGLAARSQARSAAPEDQDD